MGHGQVLNLLVELPQARGEFLDLRAQLFPGGGELPFACVDPFQERRDPGVHAVTRAWPGWFRYQYGSSCHSIHVGLSPPERTNSFATLRTRSMGISGDSKKFLG